LPAASADPDGRDQDLVRRTCATRHLRVRHWITSFPWLHLRTVMPSRARAVKALIGDPPCQPDHPLRSPPPSIVMNSTHVRHEQFLSERGVTCRSPAPPRHSKTAELRHFSRDPPCPISDRYLSDGCPIFRSPVRFRRHLTKPPRIASRPHGPPLLPRPRRPPSR
jgi:hypothetical protein